MLIKIEKIEPFKSPRGSAYGFPFGNRNHLTVLHREAGTVSGDHYHKGETQSKSPETFYLAAGKVKLFVRDIKTNKEETYEIEENHKISIPPSIYHAFTALTDIILLEFNLAEEDFRKDVVK